jgi:signal transduction histidine kinase
VVVNRHGGGLTFETKPGAGTTFYVRLPMPLEAAPAIAKVA